MTTKHRTKLLQTWSPRTSIGPESETMGIIELRQSSDTNFNLTSRLASRRRPRPLVTKPGAEMHSCQEGSARFKPAKRAVVTCFKELEASTVNDTFIGIYGVVGRFDA